MRGTVVLISMVHWHFTWQIQHNIASGLAARGYQVRFVEPLPKRWPRWSEFGRVWGRLTGHSEAAGLFVQPLSPGVELVSPRLVPDTDTLSRSINRHLFVPRIAASLKRGAYRPLIVINYLPTAASLSLMAELQPDATFYHCVNDWNNDPYAPPHFLEEELAASVDMVWADSPVNVRRTSTMSANVVAMAGGVDISIFAGARRPPRPAPPQRPLCAYFGTIGVSTDLDLLRAVSHRYPLRLIGPVRATLEGFAGETKVIGAVPQEQVPVLLQDVDVLLLPYAHTAHNDSVIPAKLFECLATGKPVVVSGLKALDEYANLFYICERPEDFLEMIGEAAREPPERSVERIACAEQNSYAKLITTIEGYFQQVLERNATRPVPSLG